MGGWCGWIEGWMNVCMHVRMDRRWVVGGHFLKDVPTLVFWWWWWLGVQRAINVAANQWHSERPAGTWITAGKSWGGGGAWVRESKGSVNEIKMHHESGWKKNQYTGERASVSPSETIHFLPHLCTFTTEFVVDRKWHDKPWLQTVKSVQCPDCHIRYWLH